MGKIYEIESGPFLGMCVGFFPLHLDHIGGAKTHTGAAGHAVVGASLRESFEFDVTPMRRTHPEMPAGGLNRDHRPV